MFEFLKDLYIVFEKRYKEYLRWKLFFVYYAAFPILEVLISVAIWGAVLSGVSAGFGLLNEDTFLTFFLSGFILWGLAANLTGGGFTQIFVAEKHRRTIQHLLASPINKMAIPYGYALFPIVETVYSAILLIILGLILGATFQGNIFLVLLIFTITFLMFSGIGLTLAALGSWREDIADMGWLLAFILQITSGVFFPLEILPAGIKNIFLSLPWAQAVQSIRMVSIQNAGLIELAPLLIPMAAFAGIMVIAAILSFKFVEKKAILVGI